jgi:hypothetical protein
MEVEISNGIFKTELITNLMQDLKVCHLGLLKKKKVYYGTQIESSCPQVATNGLIPS